MTSFAAIKFRFKQVACTFVTLTEAGFTKMGIAIGIGIGIESFDI